MDRRKLERPFADSLIKTVDLRAPQRREPPRYVEVGHYLRRLNEGTDGRWSWQVIEWFDREDQVVVRCQLTVHTDPPIVREAFGAAQIKYRRDAKTREPLGMLSLGDDLKAAATDALKKAASTLGIGLDINCEREPEEEPRDDAAEDEASASSSAPPPVEGPPPSSPATKEPAKRKTGPQAQGHLERVHELAGALGIGPEEVARRCVERYKVPPSRLNGHQAADLIRRMEAAVSSREAAAAREAAPT